MSGDGVDPEKVMEELKVMQLGRLKLPHFAPHTRSSNPFF